MGIFDFLKKGEGTTDSSRVNLDETEDIGIVTHYKGKPFTGIGVTLHDNGEVFLEVPMIDGIKHGMGKEYREDGSLDSEIEYKNDIPDGIWISYYEGEPIFEKGKQKNMIQEGAWEQIYRFENGKENIICKMNYKSGKSIGKEIFFDRWNGEEIFHRAYDNNLFTSDFNFITRTNFGSKIEINWLKKIDPIYLASFKQISKQKFIEDHGGSILHHNTLFVSDLTGEVFITVDYNHPRVVIDTIVKKYGGEDKFQIFRNSAGLKDTFISEETHGTMDLVDFYICSEFTILIKPHMMYPYLYKEIVIKNIDNFNIMETLNLDDLDSIEWNENLKEIVNRVELDKQEVVAKEKIEDKVVEQKVEKPKEEKPNENKEPKEEIIKTYYENGNRETERTFVDGEENGPAKGWFESGKLEFEAFKENGLVQGLVKNYYENGNLSIETNYIDQVKQGHENSYSENGHLVQRVKYRDGEVVYNEPINSGSFQDILSSGYTNIEIYRKEVRDNNLQEIEINWLQDLGKIYKRIEDKPVPYVLFHNPKYENDNEYLCIFVIKEIVHPELIIDQIINNNGGSSNFTKLEDNNEYNYCFQGHLFWLGYLDNKDFCVIEINRIKHELTSSDDKKLLDGIHKDSKRINSLINGLDSLIYNSGEMASGDGRLCYGLSGRIVSYWSDPKKLIKRFKNIAKNYQENIYMSVDFSDFEGKLSKYADLNETELVKFIDDERFHMQIKTKDFEIIVSKGTSSYQMNINNL